MRIVLGKGELAAESDRDQLAVAAAGAKDTRGETMVGSSGNDCSAHPD